MSAAQSYSAYRHAELETISPRDLLVRLFQGMERFIDQAAMAAQNKQYELTNDSCRRVRDIVFELQATLNFDAGGEIAKQLDAVYVFMVREVTEANLSKDANRLRALLRVVRPLREAWQAIPDAHAYTTSLTGESHRNVINMRG